MNFQKTLLISFILLFFIHSAMANEYIPCIAQPEKLERRSLEIQKLEQQDQQERENWENFTEDDWLSLAKKDRKRRKRIGEIFGEGCFHSAGDYANAALIYQHGDMPDHFYQAFIWANKAASLGLSQLKDLAALAVDRYLISINKKQLFGSQASKKNLKEECYCMEPVEPSFPDSYRIEYAGFSLQEKIDWIISLNQGRSCPILECTTKLEPTPKGSIPGFW